MTYYYFSKSKSEVFGFQDMIIVFKQGEMGSPVCILGADDVERLIKEWKKVVK